MGAGIASVPFKLAFGCALSLSLLLPSPRILRPKASAVSPPPSRKRAAASLLAFLGGVDPPQAQELRSCLRFLVPSDPPLISRRGDRTALARRDLVGVGHRREDDMMVWWPPVPVMELARLAVDSGGDPAALQREIDLTMLKVPDVKGCKQDRCQLTRTPYGRRFSCEELNSYFAFLFELIVSRGPSVGLDASLSRYDLFHGHIFLAAESGRLGILFHAKEYPAYDKKVFPINMGYCQKGSNVEYDDSINLRNILWLAPLPCKETRAWMAPGVLVVLDAHPDGVIYKDLVPEYVDYVRTIYEEDFGEDVADINYLNLESVAPGKRIFLC